MSYSGPRNSNVRLFQGGINALEYWIGNRLLSASDIVNDSSVTGANVKLALNTLSSTSSAVFPFTATGLAEKDLVSYDAGAATWKNRTVAAALSGQVTSTMVTNSSSVPGSTTTAALNELRPNSANRSEESYLSLPLTVKAGQTITASSGSWFLFNSANRGVVVSPSTVINQDMQLAYCYSVTPTTLISVTGTANASVTTLAANKWRVTRLNTTSSVTLATVTLSGSSIGFYDIEAHTTSIQTLALGGTTVFGSFTNDRVYNRLLPLSNSATPTLNVTFGTATIGDYWDITYRGSGLPTFAAADYTTTFTVS